MLAESFCSLLVVSCALCLFQDGTKPAQPGVFLRVGWGGMDTSLSLEVTELVLFAGLHTLLFVILLNPHLQMRVCWVWCPPYSPSREDVVCPLGYHLAGALWRVAVP